MTLTCKAGFYCSAGRSIYKQALLEPDMNRDLNYEGSFISCVVPLDLTALAQSVHKVLIHGHDIIQQQTLGFMSEEGQEARNKGF